MPRQHNEQAPGGRPCLTDTDPRRHAARPSLTSARSSDEGPISILASLEYDEIAASRRRSSRRRWPWVMAALVAVTTTGYISWHAGSAAETDSLMAGAGSHASSGAVAPVAPAPSSAPMAAVSSQAPTSNAPASAPQGARIETVVPASVTAPAQGSAPTSGHDPFAALSQERVTSAPAGEAASAPPVAKAHRSPALAAARSAKAASTSHASAERKIRHAPVTKHQTSRPAKRKHEDPDVDLLAALMAHAASPASAAQKPVHRRADGREKAGAPDDLSIAKLVQRCEEMQGSKAAECRRRICEGYWGKAQACPAPRPAAKGEAGAR